MVLSLLAYFFSMITAFTVLATVWIGLIGASPFQTVHLQPYPQPVIADVAAAPIAPPKSEIDAQADAKAKRLTQARAHERASLAQQRQERANFVALGYVEPGAAFSPAFAPVYPVSAGQRAVN